MHGRDRAIHILKESGLAWDSPRLLQRIDPSRWLRIFAYRIFRLRYSPAILLARDLERGTLAQRSKLFSLAVSSLNLGATYKTTSHGRTRNVDKAILRFVTSLGSAKVMEVGVSDGMSALELYELLPKGVEFALTDRHPWFYCRKLPFGMAFYDAEKHLFAVKLLCFYLNFGQLQKPTSCSLERIPTVNPAIQEHLGADAIRAFDACCERLPEPVQVIKAANLLHLSYFTPEALRECVLNLAQSLLQGGRIYLSHNNEKYIGGEAYFVLERQGESLAVVEQEGEHEALHLFSGDMG